MNKIYLTLAFFLLFSLNLHAEVLNQSATGFNLRIIQSLKTDPQTAYQLAIHPEKWWLSDHSWFGDAQNLSIDPRAGGCFCEKQGNREAMHMTVTYVDPGKALHMIGGLGPLQMIGIHGGMSWKFSDKTDIGSEITLSYAVTGYYPDGMETLAPIVDQVLSAQMRSLAKAVENQ